MLRFAAAFSLLPSGAASCLAFGKGGLAEVGQCDSLASIGSLEQTEAFEGKVSWACEVPDVGLALVNEDANKIMLWSGNDFHEIGLNGFTAPVGCTYSEGRIYVAAFGSWPTPKGDSGLVVINPQTREVESAHVFPDSRMHVHNVYAFQWHGQTQIFAAVLGNPWEGPVSGKGLVRFDETSSSFVMATTTVDLSVRSAKQQSDGTIYALTQEPSGERTKLARLVQVGDQLVLNAEISLPERNGGDGGADVVLGLDLDTVWCSDRTAGSGKLYHYVFKSGGFSLVSERETGNNPRYTTLLPSGDIVSCDQDEAALSVYQGLAARPADESITQVKVSTVNTVSFFMQTSLVQQAQEVQV